MVMMYYSPHAYYYVINARPPGPKLPPDCPVSNLSIFLSLHNVSLKTKSQSVLSPPLCIFPIFIGLWAQYWKLDELWPLGRSWFVLVTSD